MRLGGLSVARVACLALFCAAALAFTVSGASRARAQRQASAQQQPTPQVTPQPTAQPSPQPSPRESPSPAPPKKPEAVADDDVLSVNTDLVNVLFNAADKNRRFVTTLARDDVRVFEDDAPQSVSVFQRETDLPLSLALLVDVSGSQETTLPDEQEAAREFIESVLRPGKDTAAVVSFTGTATVEQDMTQDRALLEKAIARLQVVEPPDEEAAHAYRVGEDADVVPQEVEQYGMPGTTALWDAVWATSNELLAQTPAQTRRAIILLSDGDDSGHPWARLERSDAVAAAIKSDTTIYSVGVEPDCPGHQSDCRLDKKALRRVAEETGGRAFFPENDDELRAAFAEINQELRTQYLVAYSPTNKVRDGGWRRIRIEIANPKLKDQKIKLTYREGYFATARAAPRPKRERAPQERLRRPPRKSRRP
ncbi:MAG: VWA domain-containing protein [Acidobacteria bacterium]|nr:VWA domain-containing protein [Acidobacteriota bacterium]